MRYTVILVPDADGLVSVTVPALPGYVSASASRDEAIAHIREAIVGWLAVGSDHGRQPPPETPAVVARGVAEALSIIDEMREAGEIAADNLTVDWCRVS